VTTATTLTVNGKPYSADGIASLGDLLAKLDIRPQRVVVELNGEIHRRGEGLDTPMKPGDVVEIVHFVGGG
jgi:thiamine biosynthesis protein ThiS